MEFPIYKRQGTDYNNQYSNLKDNFPGKDRSDFFVIEIQTTHLTHATTHELPDYPYNTFYIVVRHYELFQHCYLKRNLCRSNGPYE